MIVDELGLFPETGVFFHLIMLLFTERGRSYGLEELRGLCAETGFGELDHVLLSDTGHSLLFAHRQG